MKKELKVWAMTCIAFWYLAPNQLKSQDSLSVRQLQDLYVTASKFPKSAANTGKVLLVIDSAELQLANGRDLSQILADQAGVYVNGAASNPGKDKAIYLRGGATHHTLILINGIPLTDPSGVNGVIDLRQIPTGSVKRIEILKGSQSLLYGSDAVAGVINIITDNAPGSSFVDVSGSYGTYESFDGRINAGWLLSPVVQLTAGVSRFSSDGFSEAIDSLSTGNFDNDQYAQTSYNVGATISAAQGLVIRPFFTQTSLTGEYDAGAYADDTTAVYDGKLLRTGVTANYSHNKNDFTILAAYNKSDRNYSNAFGDFDYSGELIHSEAIWKRRLDRHTEIISGISWQRQEMDGDDLEVNDLASPYVSFSYTRDQSGIEGGIRYNHHSAYGSNWVYSLNPYWRLGKVKLFANVGTGFKAPTLTQLYGQYGPNPDLEPERSLSMEAGALYFTKNFDVRLVLFRRDTKDLIIYTSRYENIDEQHVRGIEIEPVWRPVESFEISGYYALIDGEITTITPEGDSTYQDLIRKPKHSFGINVMLKPFKDLSVRVRYRNYSKREDRFFNMNTFITETVTLGAYDLLSGQIDYSFSSQFSVYLNMENLLDEGYQEVYGYNVRGRTFQIGGRFRI